MKSKTQQQNIPSGWRNASIDDICYVTKGQGLSKKDIDPSGKNKCILYGELFTTYDEVIKNVKKRTNSSEGIPSVTGDILIPGSTTTVARDLAVASALNENGVLLGGDINILRKKDDFYEPNFLAYYLTHYKKDEIGKLGQGTTIVHLYGSNIKDLEVVIPKNIKEQQKIAEILRTVDEYIAKTQEVIEITEKLKRGLMQQLFARGIGYTKFKETRIGQIPESWDIEKIGDHTTHVGSGATPRGGSKVYLTEGVPFIRSQNVYFEGLIQGDLVYISEQTHKEMSRSRTFPNDVLLNITGASIGRACVIPIDLLDANVNQHVCIIRPSKNLLYKYLFYFLQSENGQNQIFKFQIGGNREGLNFQQIRSIELPFPKDIKKQEQIADILSAVDKKILVNNKLKEKLTLLKKGLIQDLLSGKVRTNI
jgi:type I restriction enzyme S subunit